MKYKKDSNPGSTLNLSVNKTTYGRVLATQNSRRGILTKCGLETIQSKPENHTMQNFRNGFNEISTSKLPPRSNSHNKPPNHQQMLQNEIKTQFSNLNRLIRDDQTNSTDSDTPQTDFGYNSAIG